MRVRLNFLCVVIFFISSFFAKGQSDKYEEFIIKDKIYKPGCSWLRIAYGKGFNWKTKSLEDNATIAYSIRLQNIYLQAGYHISNDKFFKGSLQKLNDMYLAIGTRRETQKSNIAIFAGVSRAYGANYHHTDSLGRSYYKGFTAPGFYASAEYSFKIFYDLGMGLTLFESINKSYNVTGIQLHVYFSGAFKGEIK